MPCLSRWGIFFVLKTKCALHFIISRFLNVVPSCAGLEIIVALPSLSDGMLI